MFGVIFFQVIAKLDDISSQLENLQNLLSQSTNFLAYNHKSTMEQRLSSVDQHLIRNPMMMPPTLTTDVPRPKMVTNNEKPGEEGKNRDEIDDIMNKMTINRDILQRYRITFL